MTIKKIRRVKSRKSTLGVATKYGVSVAPLESIRQYIEGKTPTKQDNAAVSFYLTARSDAEASWREIGKPLIEHEIGGRILFSGYEWVSFKIPGGDYTPDWMYLMDNGKTVFVEIKASRMQTNYRDARSKLRAAASMNPWYTFVEALWEKRVWTLDIIKADLHIIETLIANGETGRHE